MKGWFGQPHRHSLAARGVRTRGIENPVADPVYYQPGIYEDNPLKERRRREFVGSGLERLSTRQVLDEVNRFISEFDGSREWEEGRLEDYYDMLDRMFDLDTSYEDFKEIYSEGGHFFEVKAVYLFGSRVSGFWTDESDIDVYLQIKPIWCLDAEYVDRIAEKLREAIVNYLYDEDRFPTVVDNEGHFITVDVIQVSTKTPEEYYWGYPMLKIWEAGD
jgi:predicted nucleotidyltransferase